MATTWRPQFLPVTSGTDFVRDRRHRATVVGRAGVLEQLEIELWPKEAQGLAASARALQEIWSKVKPKG